MRYKAKKKGDEDKISQSLQKMLMGHHIILIFFKYQNPNYKHPCRPDNSV